jgi:glycosyltransferase involved in cell wall biosynthesis
LIANIVHTSLNPRGGSERLAITAMQALSKMGSEINLTTFERPNISHLESAYGEAATSVIKRIKTTNILRSPKKTESNKHFDLIINTHGDMLPYFLPSFSKSNAITYCHFPLAKYLIDSRDPEYAKFLRSTILSTMSTRKKNSYQKYFDLARTAYIHMLKKTTVLSNSEFSRSVIKKAFGVDSVVLSPPVDVDFFRNMSLLSSSSSNNNNNNDTILVISRFHPTKKIENAIRLAKLLKERKIGSRMKIVGNLPPGTPGYLYYLKQMVDHYDLDDYVKFEINVNFGRLLKLMRESKVYLHPLVGEPFGISTVEAMSSGLIPVVPNIGGHTEFVPPKYQYRTFGEGVEAITAALMAPDSERMLISDSVKRFSIDSFINHFQEIIENIISSKIKP